MSSDRHVASGTEGEPLVRVRGLTKYFDTEDSLLDRLFGDTTPPVRAVDDIDFEIQPGETFGLVGESGCGKSTTGETVLQLLEPTDGTVEYDGVDLVDTDDLFSFRRRTGVVFQDPYSSIDPRMTIEEILTQPLEIHDWPWPASDVEVVAEVDDDGIEPTVSVADDIDRVDGVDPIDGVVTVTLDIERIDGDPADVPTDTTVDPSASHGTVAVDGMVVRVGTSQALSVTLDGGATLDIHVAVGRSDAQLRRERAARFLERVGLSGDQLERYPNEFSGGQRQRIGIARALMLDPDFLVLDEPTSALDVSVQAQVLNLLADLKEEFNLTYLIISHDLSVIRHICDRVAVMYLGELVEVAPVEELFESPKHPYTKALLESVPRPEVRERDRDVEPLTGDVPSPRNPPSGCRFRTRCPVIIPPPAVDLSQEQFRAIMDLRDRLESGSITVESTADEETTSVDRLRDRIDSLELPAEHDETVGEALELIAETSFDEAESLLAEAYETVCERDNPPLELDDHLVACHHYDDSV